MKMYTNFWIVVVISMFVSLPMLIIAIIVSESFREWIEHLWESWLHFQKELYDRYVTAQQNTDNHLDSPYQALNKTKRSFSSN